MRGDAEELERANDGPIGPVGDTGNVIDPGTVETPKRGRGRPPKSASGTGSVAGKPSGKPGTRRPERTKNQASLGLDVGTITLGVSMFGAFIANRAKQPMLKLDDDEATQIAEASANVASHYNVPISPVAQAWIGLAGTIGAIYFAKVSAIRLSKSMTVEGANVTT